MSHEQQQPQSLAGRARRPGPSQGLWCPPPLRSGCPCRSRQLSPTVPRCPTGWGSSNSGVLLPSPSLKAQHTGSSWAETPATCTRGAPKTEVEVAGQFVPGFSSKEQKMGLGCSRVRGAAGLAVNPWVWGFRAKKANPKPNDSGTCPCRAASRDPTEAAAPLPSDTDEPDLSAVTPPRTHQNSCG